MECLDDEQWLSLANNLMEHAIAHFYDDRSGMFFYSSDLDPPLVARKMELDDNVTPASNSTLAHGLLSLGKLYDKKEFVEIAEQMIINMRSVIERIGDARENIFLKSMVFHQFLPILLQI